MKLGRIPALSALCAILYRDKYKHDGTLLHSELCPRFVSDAITAPAAQIRYPLHRLFTCRDCGPSAEALKESLPPISLERGDDKSHTPTTPFHDEL